MKELSIEEKAVLYDEALLNMKRMVESGIIEECYAKGIFSEFEEESEDERIRKVISNILLIDSDEIREILYTNNVLMQDIDAWLEKQGEQKPIKEHNACEFCEDRYGCVNPCSMKLIEEEKPVDKIESRQEELTEFEKAVKQVMEEAIECGDTHNLKADADMLLRLVQKSSWSEEDEEQLDRALYMMEQLNMTKSWDDVYNWLKSFKERVKPQKQEWSEEDIELLDNTIKFIEDRVAATSPSLRTYSPTLTGKEIPFLKSLKDRVQPKQEWSEKDEKVIDDAESWLDMLCSYLKNNSSQYIPVVKEVISKLKSLRLQSTWRPSDEQMLAINTAINVLGKGTINGKCLIELQEQLKKLMEK